MTKPPETPAPAAGGKGKEQPAAGGKGKEQAAAGGKAKEQAAAARKARLAATLKANIRRRKAQTAGREAAQED